MLERKKEDVAKIILNIKNIMINFKIKFDYLNKDKVKNCIKFL